MFRFTRAQMGGVEQEVAGLKREGYKLLEGARSSGYGAAPALQYEPTRGCHLNFRSTTVKLVGMKMFGIGTATGLVAAAGLANDSTRSCALGCAINYVAAYFYFLIYTVRRQGWVGGPFGLGDAAAANGGRRRGNDGAAAVCARSRLRRISPD